MTEIQKQILVGSLIGILICVATFIALGGKREDLAALTSSVRTLEKEVEKGKQMKANALILRKEVEEQKKQLDALIALMPSETERGELPIRLKKLADSSGMDQVQFRTASGTPHKDKFYTAYPIDFSFRSGFHDFGRFASLISGFEKMVNVNTISLKRQGAGTGIYPVNVTCTITAFVYNPDAVSLPAAGKPGAKKAAPAASGEAKGD